VWNMGEYPEEYDNGRFTGAPNTWFSGLRGALAGIHMLADPKLGTPRYLQGFAPAIDFLDCARVFGEHQKFCAPVKCFDDVLVTDETSPLEDPNAHQRKYHAPGVGIFRVAAVDDPEGETLLLTSLKQLTPLELALADLEALKLEQHAYKTNDVYKKTPPMLICTSDSGEKGGGKNDDDRGLRCA
jgi:hypothetical protein